MPALAQGVLEERLAGYVEDGDILSKEITSKKAGDLLVVTLLAECEEQIGKFVDAPD